MPSPIAMSREHHPRTSGRPRARVPALVLLRRAVPRGAQRRNFSSAMMSSSRTDLRHLSPGRLTRIGRRRALLSACSAASVAASRASSRRPTSSAPAPLLRRRSPRRRPGGRSPLEAFVDAAPAYSRSASSCCHDRAARFTDVSTNAAQLSTGRALVASVLHAASAVSRFQLLPVGLPAASANTAAPGGSCI